MSPRVRGILPGGWWFWLLLLAMGLTWPQDDAGRSAGQCSFVGSAGTPVLCSPTDPLPTGGAPTQSTNDPTGFGKQFFTSSATFTGAAGPSPVFVSDQQILAFQRNVGAAPQAMLTWLSINGGRTWALVSTSTTLFNVTNTFVAARVGGAYLVGVGNIGAGGGLLRSTNADNWTAVPLSGAAAGSVNSIAAQGTTVLVGRNSDGTICRSTDSGATFATCVDFAAITGFTIGPQGIASPTASTWLIGGTDGTVGRSTDDGGSFTNVLSIGEVSVKTHLICLSATVCLASGGGSIRRSTNAGATWTNVFAIPGTGTLDGFVNYGSGVVVTVPATATPFYRSVDFGATWQFQGTMPAGLSSPLGSIDVNSGRAIVGNAVNGAGPLLYSPVVGAGETIIAGASGSRWDIDGSGRGFTRSVIANSAGTTFAAVSGGLRLDVGMVFATGGNARTCSTPAADTAASVSVAGVANQRVSLSSYVAFYTTAPAAAQTLTVTDAATTVWRDIVNGANTPTRHAFGSPPLYATTANSMTVTLPAGGAGVSGVLCVAMDQFQP
ncbi:MAG: WD40/YVTN/BNR-like repeat-containing protein [Candidatus Methylomirabilales bacterium]